MYGDISAKAAQMLSLPKVPLTKLLFSGCYLLSLIRYFVVFYGRTVGATYYISLLFSSLIGNCT